MTDAIRRTGLGDAERYPCPGKFPATVERVAIYVWCKPWVVLLELVGVGLVATGLR